MITISEEANFVAENSISNVKYIPLDMQTFHMGQMLRYIMQKCTFRKHLCAHLNMTAI